MNVAHASETLPPLKCMIPPSTIAAITASQIQTLNLWRQYQTRRRDITSCSLSASSAP